MYNHTTRDVPMRPKFTAIKSMMIRVANYDPMFSRPWTVDTRDSRVIDVFHSETNGGTDINHSAMAKVAGSFIAPQAIAGMGIRIDNGLAAPRIAFMMIVDESHPNQITKRSTVISGYTDIADYTVSGTINPETKFYINAAIQLQTSTNGNVRSMDNYHLISGNAVSGHDYNPYSPPVYNPYNREGDILSTMRPADIIRGMAYLGENNTQQLDCSSTVAPGHQVVSRRANDVGGRYLSAILKPVITNINDPSASSLTSWDSGLYDEGYKGQFGTVYDNARSNVVEPSITNFGIIRHLKEQFIDFGRYGFVTWGDLCYTINNLNETSALFTQGTTERLATEVDHLRAHGDKTTTGYWEVASLETMIATIIANALPAFMTNMLIMHLTVEMTNATVDGQPVVNVTNIGLFDERLPQASIYNALQQQLLFELMPMITRNNEIIASVLVTADLGVDAKINVCLDGGGGWVRYDTPTFCDAMYTPILASNRNTVDDLTRNTHSLVQSATQHQSNFMYN